VDLATALHRDDQKSVVVVLGSRMLCARQAQLPVETTVAASRPGI
jgi:hypothetical protein